MVQAVFNNICETNRLYASEWLEFQCGEKWNNQDAFSDELGQPQPNQTLGVQYHTKCQQFPDAFRAAQEYICQLQPGRNLVCPLLTVEVQGPEGSLHEAILQNRHNGACMLKNIVALRRAAKQQPVHYRGLAQALTIEITPESVQVSCHWIVTADGHDRYLSLAVSRVDLSDFRRARQLIENSIGWVEQQLKDLDAVLFHPLGKDASRGRKRKDTAEAGKTTPRKKAKKRVYRRLQIPMPFSGNPHFLGAYTTQK